MAKFIMFAFENHKFKLGLNEDLAPYGGIYFTDTNQLSNYINLYKPKYWVFDVEIPDGEQFISYDNTYLAQRVILSNPRRLWKDYQPEDPADVESHINPEFVEFINNIPSNFYCQRTFIARKNNNHQLISTSFTHQRCKY